MSQGKTRKAGITLAATLCLVTAAQALECHDSGQSWREIDGRRCWFDGPRRLPKSELHWPRSAPARTDVLQTVGATVSARRRAREEAADIDQPPPQQPLEPHITVLKVKPGSPSPAPTGPSFEERWKQLQTMEGRNE